MDLVIDMIVSLQARLLLNEVGMLLVNLTQDPLHLPTQLVTESSLKEIVAVIFLIAHYQLALKTSLTNIICYQVQGPNLRAVFSKQKMAKVETFLQNVRGRNREQL